MKKVIFYSTTVFFCFICISISKVDAATLTASDCSKAAVESTISLANTGDLVVIPAGSCSWASAVTLNKSITVKGQTTTSRNSSTYVVTPTDGTIIQKYGFNVTATTGVRITGITFDGNVVSPATEAITLPKSPIGMRIDHNHFSHYRRIWDKGGGGGYLNVLLDNNRITQPGEENLYIVGKGNTSWSDGGPCGSSNPEKTTWLEDNEWILETADIGNPIDSGEGARIVIRNNLFSGTATRKWIANLIETHGHCRAYWDGYDVAATYCLEVSGNKVTQPSNPSYIGQNFMKIRGGRSYTYNNTINGTGWSGENVLFYIEETAINCNNPYPCNVQAHEDAGYHAVPLSGAANYTNGMCTTWPCPMQPDNSYVWNNTKAGGSWINGVQGNAAFMIVNRDWWDDSGAGGTNIISGTSRPGTCTVNDSYWETDNKKLYRCTAANVWTLVYTAYEYPHPFTLSTLSIPSSPQNVRITQP
jgi:hypothetical protein